MKTIHDNDFRHALIERFLDCDTTVEEEQALARFYRECKLKDCVPGGENEICEMVIATVQLNDAAIQPQITNAEGCVCPRHTILRWLAAACIVVAAVCGAVVAFRGNTDKPALALDKKAMKAEARQMENDTTAVVASATETMNIAQNNCSAEKTESQMTQEPRPARRKASTQASGNASSTSSGNQALSHTSEITRLYGMVLDMFGDATDITIVRKGDVILLSAVNAGGKTERYAVAMSDGDEPILVAL